MLQLYASESTVRDTHLDEIKANKYQASLGLRSRRGRLIYGFAVTENVANYQNTPDVGLSLTLGWINPERPAFRENRRTARPQGRRPPAPLSSAF